LITELDLTAKIENSAGANLYAEMTVAESSPTAACGASTGSKLVQPAPQAVWRQTVLLENGPGRRHVQERVASMKGWRPGKVASWLGHSWLGHSGDSRWAGVVGRRRGQGCSWRTVGLFLVFSGCCVGVHGTNVAQTTAVLKKATEKLEFDEYKLQTAQTNLANDQQAVQDDIHAVNHPLAVGAVNIEGVMMKGKIDTVRLRADQPAILVMEAIVEEDKERLAGAQLDYERALTNASPTPPTAVPAPSIPLTKPNTSVPAAEQAGRGAQPGGAGGLGGEGGARGAGGAEVGEGADKGKAHYDDSAYYPSRHWASCPPCSGGSPQEIAEWLETTMEGTDWLQSEAGLDWLISSKGCQWLRTPQGAEWPFTQAGESFFTSDWGRQFLQSDPGQEWLGTPPGLRWLREHKPWAASILRLRNAALACLLAMCTAGLLSAYLTPKKEDASIDTVLFSERKGPLL